MLESACAHDHARVLDDIEARTGGRADLQREPDDAASIPPGVSLRDGLDRDEAVAIALWNNPNLRAELTRLDAADAELAGARRPTNPTLRLLFPVGAGVFAGLLTWPIETLATMPGRAKLARLRQAASADAVVIASLDLTRDARLAHANWVLAHERLALRAALEGERSQLLAISEAQASLGALSEAEAETVRAEAAIAADELGRARTDVALAESQLRSVIGWGLEDIALTVAPEPLDALPASPLARAQAAASERRPELDAARLEVELAHVQLQLERAAIFNLAAVGQLQGSALQLGPQSSLPIFDQNQAGRGRARATLAAAGWRQRALRERIAGEVREAHARFEQALRSHERYRDEIVGSRERTLASARRTYELGDGDFAGVLLAEQNLDLARLRLVELGADARRAHAELERALGDRLTTDAEVLP